MTSFDAIDNALGRKDYHLRIFPNKLSELIARLNEHGLVFEFTFQSTLHESVFGKFHDALVNQCTTNNFTINSTSYSLAPNIPTYAKSLFRLLKGGNNAGNGQKLNDAKLEHYEFTPANLGKVIMQIRNPDSGMPLLFFGKMSPL